LQKSHFFEKHLIFPRFSEKQTLFSGRHPVFQSHFPENSIIFHRTYAKSPVFDFSRFYSYIILILS